MHKIKQNKGRKASCCGSSKSSLGQVQANSSHGKQYFIYETDEAIEYASVHDIRCCSLKGAQPIEKQDTPAYSLQYKATISAIAVFLVVWGLQGLFALPSTVAFFVNISVLLVMVVPNIVSRSTYELVSMVALFISAGLMLSQSSIFAFSLLGAGFHYLLSKGKPTTVSIISISSSMAVIGYLASVFSPFYAMAAAIPLSYSIAVMKEGAVDCSFSLALSVVFMVSVALSSHFLGMGQIICLHDAVLAASIMFAKDIAKVRYRSNPRKFFVSRGDTEEVLDSDIEVLGVDGDLTVNLDKLDSGSLVARGVIHSIKGHEEKYTLKDFPTYILPKGATVVGQMVGVKSGITRPAEEGEEELSSKLSDLDKLVGYLVPIFMLVSGVTALGVGITYGPTQGVIVGVQTLIAACPCLFLVLPYLEYRLASMFAGKNIQFNFRNKLLSKWPELNRFGIGFDRTRTMCFPDPQNPDGEYKMDPAMKDYIQTNVRGKRRADRGMFTPYMFFMSGAAGDPARREQFLTELKSVGVQNDGNIYLDKDYSNGLNKFAGYQKVKKLLYNVYWCDGDNDVKIAMESNVMAVAVNPVEGLLSAATVIIKHPAEWKSGGALGQIVEEGHSAQQFARGLLKQILMTCFIMMALPSLSQICAISLPLWTNCALMLGSVCTMGVQIEIYSSVRSKKLKISPYEEAGVLNHVKTSANEFFGRLRTSVFSATGKKI